ncbi:hypothetical protein NA57DRAFT_72933 [Rhizodiscina lignyota]|uniref:Endoplasmic reticulum protein n=1 Tax=Rhizodiscina lignyota TaxID=1504668 RepID=A0A9P4IK76_9PEZI|nr:hypothetical protein NA57DRAFT_72933 [Rhizodiscina lignyota]
MAPPPSSSMPLQQRVIALASTLQFAWFLGHLTLLFCTFRYGMSYITFNFNSRWAKFSYRTAFIAAAVTYGIVVSKAYRAKLRQHKQAGALQMAQDENVQYLVMALIWLFSRQIPLAILPFAVYSVFHVLTYTRANLLPTIFPPPQQAAQPASPNQKTAKQSSALADGIGKFVKDYYDSSMTLVAVLEIVLWFRLLGSSIMFQKGSWILIMCYTVFLRARYAQSSFVQGAFAQIGARIDAQAAQQGTPAAVRNGWEAFKGIARQGVEATDLSKYVGGAQGGPKKAQ